MRINRYIVGSRGRGRIETDRSPSITTTIDSFFLERDHRYDTATEVHVNRISLDGNNRVLCYFHRGFIVLHCYFYYEKKKEKFSFGRSSFGETEIDSVRTRTVCGRLRIVRSSFISYSTVNGRRSLIWFLNEKKS